MLNYETNVFWTFSFLLKNSNILSAALCLVKELDYPSLEVLDMAVRCRMDELDEWHKNKETITPFVSNIINNATIVLDEDYA